MIFETAARVDKASALTFSSRGIWMTFYSQLTKKWSIFVPALHHPGVSCLVGPRTWLTTSSKSLFNPICSAPSSLANSRPMIIASYSTILLVIKYHLIAWRIISSVEVITKMPNSDTLVPEGPSVYKVWSLGTVLKAIIILTLKSITKSVRTCYLTAVRHWYVI